MFRKTSEKADLARPSVYNHQDQLRGTNQLTVVPGFIDAHCHPAASGVDHVFNVDCDQRRIAEIQEAIRTRAARTKAGEWVFGFKYDDTKLSDQRPLTRADLDAAAPR